MMSATIVQKSLPLWGFKGASYQLAAARENQVYRVQHKSGTFALRLHRAGYRTHPQLHAELAWMHQVASNAIAVPSPVATLEGGLLASVDGLQVDVLEWMPGETLAQIWPELDDHQRRRIFSELGQQMARLHQVSDAWQKPPGFDRPRWNADGLIGDQPLWGRFWENPGLTQAERDLLLRLRQRARMELNVEKSALDYGLIHADLVGNNVLVQEGNLYLIDFDDGGFGFRLFDLATALGKHWDDEGFEDLRAALLDGYRSVRAINCGYLSLFLALRAATYVGWNIARLDEPGAAVRNKRFIDSACRIAHALLT